MSCAHQLCDGLDDPALRRFVKAIARAEAEKVALEVTRGGSKNKEILLGESLAKANIEA